MIDWLQALDVWLFRFVNESLRNSVFDQVMPALSSPPFFVVLVITIFILLICKGGIRGRICAITLILGLFIGDTVISNSIKHAVGRLRPPMALQNVHLLIGLGPSFSMPSSHAVNWFCAMIISFIYYRRSIRFMLPLAVAVSFSRVYNGVHFPSDILVGAILGAGTGAFLVWTLDALWKVYGPKFFPNWAARLPSLAYPGSQIAGHAKATGIHSVVRSEKESNVRWLRFGYVVTGLLLLARLIYLASGKIELSEDEAYQWIWSKHLAFSYFSKPPLIAYTQYLGTHLWGDTQFGIRFFSPVIAAILSLLLLRFFAREVNAKTGTILVLIVSATPLTALGATLMTVDPLLVLFWTAAMVAGWRAVQPNGTTRQWCWVGLWMGLGFLSKYTNLFQLLCWIVFFCLWPPSRKHLRKPGPYLALGINLLAMVPVLIWNAQHHWITVEHVAGNGNLNAPFKLQWRFTKDFILSEFWLLHPVFITAMTWAAIGFWRRDRKSPLFLYFFSMGAPLFAFYFLLSYQSRIFPNWIAAGVLPMFCLMALYWNNRWAANSRRLNRWLAGSIVFGIFMVAIACDTNLVKKLFHLDLPANVDPLHRVHGWKSLAKTVGDAREKLSAEGKSAFIVGEHYGFTSLVTFYLPEAKRRVATDPLVFVYATDHPKNQFYFWPNYLDRKGENAIFFREIGRPPMRPGWFSLWLHGSKDLFLQDKVGDAPLPPEIQKQFETIEDWGVANVVFGDNRIMRRVQIFACRNLR